MGTSIHYNPSLYNSSFPLPVFFFFPFLAFFFVVFFLLFFPPPVFPPFGTSFFGSGCASSSRAGRPFTIQSSPFASSSNPAFFMFDENASAHTSHTLPHTVASTGTFEHGETLSC